MRLRPRARPILSTSAASAAHLPVVYSALPAVLTRSALSLSRMCSRALLLLLVLGLLTSTIGSLAFRHRNFLEERPCAAAHLLS